MKKSKLSSTWTTVTPLSKTIAMILFIALPFIGFYYGYNFPKPSYPESQAITLKTYQEPEGYFEFQYPSNWRIDLSNKDYSFAGFQGIPKDKRDITLSSTQGKIDISWGDSYGGACPTGYEKIQLNNETLTTCHQVTESSEVWGGISDKLNNQTGLGVLINAQVDPPLSENRQTVLNILSSIKLNHKN